MELHRVGLPCDQGVIWRAATPLWPWRSIATGASSGGDGQPRRSRGGARPRPPPRVGSWGWQQRLGAGVAMTHGMRQPSTNEKWRAATTHRWRPSTAAHPWLQWRRSLVFSDLLCFDNGETGDDDRGLTVRRWPDLGGRWLPPDNDDRLARR
jgi:hypothetical protein